jgi:hypothetical protein
VPEVLKCKNIGTFKSHKQRQCEGQKLDRSISSQIFSNHILTSKDSHQKK